MICILRIGPDKEIKGWVMDTNIDDIRRTLHATGETELAQMLYRMTFAPRPGKHDLGGGYVMLVS